MKYTIARDKTYLITSFIYRHTGLFINPILLKIRIKRLFNKESY